MKQELNSGQTKIKIKTKTKNLAKHTPHPYTKFQRNSLSNLEIKYEAGEHAEPTDHMPICTHSVQEKRLRERPKSMFKTCNGTTSIQLFQHSK
jgi:dipeptidase